MRSWTLDLSALWRKLNTPKEIKVWVLEAKVKTAPLGFGADDCCMDTARMFEWDFKSKEIVGFKLFFFGLTQKFSASTMLFKILLERTKDLQVFTVSIHWG